MKNIQRSYDKEYLQAAQDDMAAMFDVAVYFLNYKLYDFYSQFLKHDYSSRFAKGDPLIIWGKSGTEIAFEIANADIEDYIERLNQRGLTSTRSPEYWAGWALAYYQWYSGKNFSEINKSIDIDSIVHLYNPYHEMDILQFCDKMDFLIMSS